MEVDAMDLGDLVVERVVLENMLGATHVRQIPIINGLEPGNGCDRRLMLGKATSSLVAPVPRGG
jgi:hypothetical protein